MRNIAFALAEHLAGRNEKVLVLAIDLLRTHINEWQKSFATKTLLCTVCLGNNFDVEKMEFAGEFYLKFHCRRCGYTMLKASDKVEKPVNSSQAH